MKQSTLMTIALCGFLFGCGSQPQKLFGDESLSVNTPVYRGNKIFYGEKFRDEEENSRRWSNLMEPHEYETDTEAVDNGDPVSIIVNRAYVPLTLTNSEQNGRLSTLLGGSKTRDIAVLIDFGAKAGEKEEFIAAWYQRDVPPDEPLSFQYLIVYSQDSWDSRVPPYFRLRIVDVTNERNTRTGELLNQISGAGTTVASLIGSPLLAPVVNIATRAASLVLANEENRNLIDFTFNVFSTAQKGEAGGMPLGHFKAGGIVVLGQPFETDYTFWEDDFQYDFKLRRVQKLNEKANVVPAPFMIVTVMTAGAVVPNVVKRRSQRIAKVLSDRDAVRQELGDVIEDAGKLLKSLQTLEFREQFAKFPSKTSFNTMLNQLQVNWAGLPSGERNWLLSVVRSTTNINRSTVAEYVAWNTACAVDTPFSVEKREFDPSAYTGANAAQCSS
ncbi:MAG: hypothetical protein HN540_07660 [Rhodospirillaceae bacterium]|nr:hypothetical protein [Rhodospirillaceae bacterium]